MNILALIAHPDDLEIASAGTICQLTDDGHRVLIGVVTDEADLSIRKIRQAEALQAAYAMGVPAAHVLFVGQEDRFARNDKISCQLIQAWMHSHDFAPDIVITHSKNDTHQDHRAVHDLAVAATRKTASLYLYAAVINSLKADDFQPSVFVDTSRSWSRKKNALACYPSQDSLGRIRVLDIERHERKYAWQWGVSRVEAYEAKIKRPQQAEVLLQQFALTAYPVDAVKTASIQSDVCIENMQHHLRVNPVSAAPDL